MSKINRYLAREAAIRARFRRAGCADPVCQACGEQHVWRLVHAEVGRMRKGIWPLCYNCDADRRRDPVRDPEMRDRFRQAGFPEPRCPICGDDRIWRLQLDHIAGDKNDDTCWPLCGNCHADRTFAQQTLEPGDADPANPKNVFEVIGRWLLGIAEWLELIVDKLWQFGKFLIDLARQGYGGELSFPWNV